MVTGSHDTHTADIGTSCAPRSPPQRAMNGFLPVLSNSTLILPGSTRQCARTIADPTPFNARSDRTAPAFRTLLAIRRRYQLAHSDATGVISAKSGTFPTPPITATTLMRDIHHAAVKSRASHLSKTIRAVASRLQMPAEVNSLVTRVGLSEHL